ncbi:MAG: hypothetical protein RSD67_05335 [Oscillospiraceae bacterium]
MFQFCGYNFFKDGDCLNFAPTSVENITKTKLENGIFDDFYVTSDVTSPYSTTIPTMWDFMTIMQANFNGNINAGNVDFILSQLSGIKVKRRVKGTFEWITLAYFPVAQVSDLSFIFNDYLNNNFEQYEYAFVPILNNIEGNYITNDIASKFNGIFICDQETIYKFYAGVSYGTTEQVQRIGMFEPFGRKYPVYVSNALTNYKTGSVKGKVLGKDFEATGVINRLDVVKENKILLDFLTNKKAKILKDWNGNCTLLIVTGSPAITYDNNYGMGIVDTDFSYSEIGNYDVKNDLKSVGMIPDMGD